MTPCVAWREGEHEREPWFPLISEPWFPLVIEERRSSTEPRRRTNYKTIEEALATSSSWRSSSWRLASSLPSSLRPSCITSFYGDAHPRFLNPKGFAAKPH